MEAHAEDKCNRRTRTGEHLKSRFLSCVNLLAWRTRHGQYIHATHRLVRVRQSLRLRRIDAAELASKSATGRDEVHVVAPPIAVEQPHDALDGSGP